MNAPDKIYTDNRGVYAELPLFSQADANVEYIRKDSLMKRLERAKRLREKYGERDYVAPIDALINIINSI